MSIGPLPASISPGETATIPAVVRTQGLSAGLRANFSISTDDPQRPTIPLAIVAHLVEDAEILDEGAGPVVVGRPGERRFRLIERRIKGSPSKTPTVVGSRPVEVSLLGPSDEHEGPAGTIESSRVVVLVLPAVDRPGRKAGELLIRWSDGRERTRAFHWEVLPAVAVSPGTIVVKAGDGPTRVRVAVRSADGPIRINAVEGPLVAGYRVTKEGAMREHSVELTVDPTLHRGETSAIHFVTDHPCYPVGALAVLIAKEDARP